MAVAVVPQKQVAYLPGLDNRANQEQVRASVIVIIQANGSPAEAIAQKSSQITYCVGAKVGSPCPSGAVTKRDLHVLKGKEQRKGT